MSDDFLEGDDDVAVGGEDTQAAPKAGFLSGAVMQILKWAAIIIAAVIFIVTVTVITLKISNKGNQAPAYVATSEEYTSKPPVYDWFSGIGEIRARTADENPSTVIVEIRIGYEQQNKAVQTELTQRIPRIRDMIRTYFSIKTAEELKPQYEQELKLELRERINRVMTQGKVKEVIFDTFNVISF